MPEDNKPREMNGVYGFFIHPGTWMFLSLIGLTIGAIIWEAAPLLLPLAAPWLGPIVAATLSMAVIVVLPFYLYEKYKDLKFEQARIEETTDESASILSIAKSALIEWVSNHPAQAFVLTIGLALSITALVLTIGFFTGGAGFAFMAPVFVAIGAAVPLASIAAPLSVAIMAGIAFVIAPLNFSNTLQRFINWLNKPSKTENEKDDDFSDNNIELMPIDSPVELSDDEKSSDSNSSAPEDVNLNLDSDLEPEYKHAMK